MSHERSLIDNILTTHFRPTILEAVGFAAMKRFIGTAEDDIKIALSENFWGALQDEWENSPVVPDALRDTDDVWERFLDIVFTHVDAVEHAVKSTPYGTWIKAEKVR